jgi:hypothetical protein
MVLKNKKRFGHFFFFNSLDELWAYKYDNLYESALLRNTVVGGFTRSRKCKEIDISIDSDVIVPLYWIYSQQNTEGTR